MAEPCRREVIVRALAVTLAATTSADKTVLVRRTDHTCVGDINRFATILTKASIVVHVDADSPALVTVFIYYNQGRQRLWLAEIWRRDSLRTIEEVGEGVTLLERVGSDADGGESGEEGDNGKLHDSREKVCLVVLLCVSEKLWEIVG